MTTSKQRNLIDKESNFGPDNYQPLPVVLSRAKGVWVWDVDGKKYLDMMSAYSAVTHGHSHPELLKVLHEQSSRLALTSRAFYTDTLGPYLEKITSVSNFDMALPMNSGAEAVETSIKAARRWAYRSKKIEKKAINKNTAAVLVEPIQGEGGIIVPPENWLPELREICTKHGVLMILDEIQSGLGRTGKMFAFQHANIQPDGLILGKALGGGFMPVSCFLSSKEVMQWLNPGSHGSTFGGNPLAAAIGKRSLELLEEENLVENSQVLGDSFKNALNSINSPVIKEVRGKGLWIGVVIDPHYISGKELSKLLLNEGILCKETHETVIRFAPPLVITKAEMEWAAEVIKTVITRIETNHRS